MEKKYELTDETRMMIFGARISQLFYNPTLRNPGESQCLHRIRALRDFGDIHKGDLGGFIEKEENLSHDGDCWVYDNAMVYDNARVSGNARIFDDANIYCNGCVYGNSEIRRNASVYGNAEIYGCAKVSGDAFVYDNAEIYDNSEIYGNVYISKDALISSANDYFAIENIGSRHDTTTFYKCGNNIIRVNCGCFNGTLEEFVSRVKETHRDNQYAKEYMAAIEMAKVKLI